MSNPSPLGDAVVGAWFALAAVAFWSPYAGISLPAGLLNALYAVFLLVSLATLALRLLRQTLPSGAETPSGQSAHLLKEDTPRRGR